MPKKYHIDFKPTLPRYTPQGKSGVVDFREGCQRCGKCAKKACVYNVYDKRCFDSGQMTDSIDYLCKNCFRCVQSCKKGLLNKSVNPEYVKMGDAYWTPEIISTNWTQAETGKIPVSGAGYGGPFSGPGFDSMWTDMSEIVRPTRDGIHGREYINTSVDIGRKLERLRFGATGELLSEPPPLLELPLPLVMATPSFGHVTEKVRLTLAMAAARLGTFFIVAAEQYDKSLAHYKQHIIPRISQESYPSFKGKLSGHRAVEVIYAKNMRPLWQEIKQNHSEMLISIKLPLDGNELPAVEELALQGAEILHLCADEHGNEIGAATPRFIKDMVRRAHLHLVERSLRDQVTLLASGRIAMAEHVAKIIICGADAAVMDIPLLLAFECRLCKNCEKKRPCPVTMDAIEPAWGMQRVLNLMSAWRNQLLEILGAMGIREVRRLRGEAGRAMFFEDLEADIFGKIFGERI